MRRTFGILLVSLALAAGCDGATTDEAREVRLEQSGETVALNRGDALAVRLRSLGDSGYSNWQLTQPPASTLLELTEATHEAASSGTPGDFGTDVFRFVARDAGSTALEATATRPWSGETEAFRLTVEVR